MGQITYKSNSVTRMTTTRQYDYLDRLTAIASQATGTGVAPVSFNYAYNAANQRTKDALADGSYWVYGYDSLGQVTSGHKYFYDGKPVPGQQFDYSFDTIGNRTQTRAGGDQTGGNQRVANYSVNDLNQIISRDCPGTNDVVGVALATNGVTVNGQTAWRKGEYFWSTVGTNNSASAEWLNVAVGSAGWTNNGNLYFPRTPESFQYDADGNLTNDGRWSYVWDAENRLIQMTVNTNVGPQYQLNFAYDAQGRRIQKLVSTNNGSGYVCVSTNNFVYDGWNVVAIFDSSLSLQPSAFFVWGNDLSGSPQGAGGVGGLLEGSFYGSSRTNCFYAYDGNGNVAALVNAADGTIAATYEYGPFGEVVRTTGPMAKANPFRFSTKYQDDESDLVYYGYRFYDPSTGRWLSRDPFHENDNPNLYLFIANNSQNYIDPWGLWHWVGGKRDGHPRAEVAPDKDGDPYADLATMVKLDPSEVKLWLQPWKPNNQVKKCDTFTVPNTVFIDRLHPMNAEWFWRSYSMGEINEFTEDGYFILYNINIDNTTMLDQFASPDIYGLVNLADGDEGDHGSLQTTSLAGLHPGDIHLHHKLGGFKIIQCFGGELPWDRTLVAPGGYYWGWVGYLHIWNAPRHAFHQ